MAEPTRLPTHAQLGLILHRMFVDIRNTSYAEEWDPKELADIADLAELIPLQFINHHEGYLKIIVAGLRDLAAKYPRTARYAAVLDMEPTEVAAVITPVGHDWTALQPQH